MSERTEIQADVLNALQKMGIEHIRINSGKVRVKGGWMQLARSGTADVLVLIEDRMPIWIETKAKNGKPNEDQLDFAQRMLRLGHGYFIVRTMEDLTRAIA